MRSLILILALMLDVVPSGQAYLKPLTPRDSVLVADQLEYGFQLDSVRPGTSLALQDFSMVSNDTLTLVRNWKIDTLKRSGSGMQIRGNIIIAPFEEGEYTLPQIAVRREDATGRVDTLLFDAPSLEVCTMPVDTAAFVPHDIKGQMGYPLTFKEIAPWIAAFWLLAVFVILVVCLVKMRRSRSSGELQHSDDPPHIVALRRLDKFRGNVYWAPEKQKAFYSGITDALKDYIEERFGVDAPEMTTSELFSALKKEKDISPELYSDMLQLFERADFVKFAKLIATDEQNAAALPVAVRFVTGTYRTEPEEGRKEDEL